MHKFFASDDGSLSPNDLFRKSDIQRVFPCGYSSDPTRKPHTEDNPTLGWPSPYANIVIGMQSSPTTMTNGWNGMFRGIVMVIFGLKNAGHLPR